MKRTIILFIFTFLIVESKCQDFQIAIISRDTTISINALGNNQSLNFKNGDKYLYRSEGDNKIKLIANNENAFSVASIAFKKDKSFDNANIIKSFLISRMDTLLLSHIDNLSFKTAFPSFKSSYRASSMVLYDLEGKMLKKIINDSIFELSDLVSSIIKIKIDDWPYFLYQIPTQQSNINDALPPINYDSLNLEKLRDYCLRNKISGKDAYPHYLKSIAQDQKLDFTDELNFIKLSKELGYTESKFNNLIYWLLGIGIVIFCLFVIFRKRLFAIVKNIFSKSSSDMQDTDLSEQSQGNYNSETKLYELREIFKHENLKAFAVDVISKHYLASEPSVAELIPKILDWNKDIIEKRLSVLEKKYQHITIDFLKAHYLKDKHFEKINEVLNNLDLIVKKEDNKSLASINGNSGAGDGMETRLSNNGGGDRSTDEKLEELLKSNNNNLEKNESFKTQPQDSHVTNIITEVITILKKEMSNVINEQLIVFTSNNNSLINELKNKIIAIESKLGNIGPDVKKDLNDAIENKLAKQNLSLDSIQQSTDSIRKEVKSIKDNADKIEADKIKEETARKAELQNKNQNLGYLDVSSLKEYGKVCYDFLRKCKEISNFLVELEKMMPENKNKVLYKSLIEKLNNKELDENRDKWLRLMEQIGFEGKVYSTKLFNELIGIEPDNNSGRLSKEIRKSFFLKFLRKYNFLEILLIACQDIKHFDNLKWEEDELPFVPEGLMDTYIREIKSTLSMLDLELQYCEIFSEPGNIEFRVNDQLNTKSKYTNCTYKPRQIQEIIGFGFKDNTENKDYSLNSTDEQTRIVIQR